jgi:hypothetical protein
MLFNSWNVQTVEAEITAPMPPQRARDAGMRVRNTMSNGPLRVRRNRDFPAVFRNVLPASEARDVLASDKGTGAVFGQSRKARWHRGFGIAVADSSLAEEYFCTRAVFISEDKAMLLLTKRW